MTDFSQQYDTGSWSALQARLDTVAPEQVHRVLQGEPATADDLPILLAPAADALLEPMAQRARALTLQRFGRAIALYVPLYLSNYCASSCLYCGFSRENRIQRRTLTADEVAAEMEALRAQGFEHLLLVCGDHPREVPIERLLEAVSLAHRRFASVSVEVYQMDAPRYRRLVEAGCDGLVLYQETYDPAQYARMHPAGLKSDFAARLRAIEAGADAGMRSIGLGALLGLSDWRREACALGLHAAWLMKHYWRARIAFSLPRLCPAAGGFATPLPVSDRDLVHMMLALRLVFPDAELVVSTREPGELRDHILRLGVATRFSAGSRTAPGGYVLGEAATGQFDVHDKRPAAEVAHAIAQAGYDPVWKDWDRAFLE